MKWLLFIIWLTLNLYSSHFADDTGYFIAQQMCEVVILLLVVVLLSKGIFKTIIEGVTIMSVGELIQEFQHLNTEPNKIFDCIQVVSVATGILYIIIKRERTNRRHNKAA